MKKTTVALLSGGISSEREVSLKSGGQVYDALDKKKYDVIRYDPKSDLLRLVSDSANIDVALIILHGQYGEDGTVQGLLDQGLAAAGGKRPAPAADRHRFRRSAAGGPGLY